MSRRLLSLVNFLFKMPNRTKSPTIHNITGLSLPHPKLHSLSNGIPVHEISMGTQAILKLEIVFRTGRPQEHKQLVSRTTSRMLREGTLNHSSAQIAEKIDYYGGTLATPVNLDTSNIILYSLTKHFEQLLALTTEVLSNPIFPEKELETYITNSIQQIKVNQTKSDVVAYREITERIFGAEHPYGYNSSIESYRALQQADLIQHFKNQYHSGNCFIIISGDTSEKAIQLIDKYLGQAIPKGTKQSVIIPTTAPLPQAVSIKVKDNVQSAIRIGCRLFNKHHPDFKGLYILNTILGGYFGSRLMMNIREQKGYTYNIFSTVDAMIHDGYFYIGTEVGNEYLKDTLQQVYLECEKLQQDLVPEDELDMVRNYLLGNMLNMLDGPMNVSEIVRSILVDGLPLSHFGDFERTIKNITAAELRNLAQQYLQKDKMWEVIVGE